MSKTARDRAVGVQQCSDGALCPCAAAERLGIGMHQAGRPARGRPSQGDAGLVPRPWHRPPRRRKRQALASRIGASLTGTCPDCGPAPAIAKLPALYAGRGFGWDRAASADRAGSVPDLRCQTIFPNPRLCRRAKSVVRQRQSDRATRRRQIKGRTDCVANALLSRIALCALCR